MNTQLLENAPAQGMKRKEFLSLFGTGAAALLGAVCLGGCSNSGAPAPASNVDVTLDLTSSAAANLNNAAIGYVYVASGAVIVAKTTAGTYVAVQSPCTHEGVTVNYSQSNGRFICPRHNSQFSNSGAVLSGIAPSALKMYTVTQTGNSIHIVG
jgi:cytochrome b6-f complex iron-sulfur subunit